MKAMIVAVTGTPGTGKTRFAKALANRLGWKLVPLNALAARHGLYRVTDRKRGSKIVDLRRLGIEIRRLGKTENLVTESHYAHELPCDAIIVLRTPIKELAQRLRKRNWSKKKIEENVEAEIMEVVAEEARSRRKPIIVLDAREEKSVEQAARFVRRKARNAAGALSSSPNEGEGWKSRSAITRGNGWPNIRLTGAAFARPSPNRIT